MSSFDPKPSFHTLKYKASIQPITIRCQSGETVPMIVKTTVGEMKELFIALANCSREIDDLAKVYLDGENSQAAYSAGLIAGCAMRHAEKLRSLITIFVIQPHIVEKQESFAGQLIDDLVAGEVKAIDGTLGLIEIVLDGPVTLAALKQTAGKLRNRLREARTLLSGSDDE